MQICIAGKNNIAVEVTSYLIKKYGKDAIWVIPNETDNGKNNFQRSFRQYAQQEKLRITELNEVYGIKNLLFLSLEFDRIIKPELFSSQRLFNIHFSLLPKYKGMYTSALPLLFGEKNTGVTLHRIDTGIDTGEIIAQKRISIAKEETAKTLYLKYIRYGIELVIEKIDNLANDTIKSKPQSPVCSTYYSKSTIDYSSLKIDPKQTAWQLRQTIKAFCFRDYQLPKICGYPIIDTKILKTKSQLKAGTVLEDKAEYILISTIDYDLCCIKDRLDLVLKLCKEDNLTELKKIKDLHRYIEEKNKSGWTPLMVCAYNNSKKTFEYLISKGADMNAVNNNGTTVLMYAKDGALLHKDTELLEYILKNNGDINARDFSGNNILYYTKDVSPELYQLIMKYDG